MLRNLKRLRQRSGVSQKQLAAAVGVSQQSINKYENHNIEPDIATLVRIADFFNTSVDYLVGRHSTESQEEPLLTVQLTLEESRFLQGYRLLSPRQKTSLDMVLENYLEK